ncbi:hypothetical protein ACFLWI_06450 [Chloroflexota bacterium]
MKELEYEVLWPRGRKVLEEGCLAKRLDALEGKTVGFLWDWVFRGEEIFPAIENEMAKRYPGIKFVGHKVFGSTHGGKEGTVLASLSDKLKENECDAVISGVGC